MRGRNPIRARESLPVRRRGNSGARLLAATAIACCLGLAGAGSASADSLQVCVVTESGTCLNLPFNNAHSVMLGSTQVVTGVCGAVSLPPLGLPALPVTICRSRSGPRMTAYDLVGLEAPAAGAGTYTSGGLDCGAPAAGWQVSSTGAGVAVGGARDCAHDGGLPAVEP
jgi:hypothetical protein